MKILLQTSRLWTVLLLPLLLSIFSSAVMAQQNASAQSIEALAASCATCHGKQGIAPQELWPNLAGQTEGYLIAQMRAYRDGGRKDPLMTPYMTGLSDRDIERLAVHYAAMQPPAPKPGAVNEVGRNLSAYCLSCHGADGNTVVDVWPNLAGQKKAYLEKRLREFRAGGEGINPVMYAIVRGFSDKQLSDLADYFSRL